jgi:hypothetical protein
MARQKVEIQQPLAGLDRAWAVQSQPPFTLSDANNVRGRSPFDSRAILGSRPGLVKTFCQKVGGTVESFSDTFTGAADCVIGSGSPDTNFSGISTIKVGFPSALTVQRGVIRFPLTAIPAGATITAASLRIRVSDVTIVSSVDPTSGDPCYVYRLTVTNWIETEVTWNRASVATDWTDGGSYDGASGIGWNFPDEGFVGDLSIPGLVSMTQTALASGNLNIILAKGNEVAAYNGEIRQLTFDSREIPGAVRKPPKLDVTYEVTIP